MAAHRKPNPGSLRSLAEASPGEQLEVAYILFGSLRRRYEALGVRLGTRIRCREWTAKTVVVELPDGRLAEVDGVHAPFVEVRPVVAFLAPESDGSGNGGDPAPAPDPVPFVPFPDRTPHGEPERQPRIA
ncbi:MAG TPA: FeoA family protein [Longimicrobiaceae bacterium]|nr:FeoA family protein [Longimicrobiaceae bacterium]